MRPRNSRVTKRARRCFPILPLIPAKAGIQLRDALDPGFRRGARRRLRVHTISALQKKLPVSTEKNFGNPRFTPESGPESGALEPA